MIQTTDLYYVFQDGSVGLSKINLDLPSGSRTLLLGANGAGKSTLLRVLGGKTLPKSGQVLVDGQDPFRECLAGSSYLGTEWAANTTVRRDVRVTLLIASVGGDAFPERRDQLVEILDIDLTWRMHAVSDGERRRVQLCMGLLQPWTTLLLDEVTVDLDVLVRARLLDFLRQETESRPCQIVYATHIFDGLMDWPTHLVHMHLGTVEEHGPSNEILAAHEATNDEQPTAGQKHRGTALLELALSWLESDLARRGKRETKPQWADLQDTVETSLDHGNNFNSYFKLTRGRR